MRRRSLISTVIHKVTHKGIEIVFDASKDEWLYTLRGRDRKAKSLGAAMIEIDKPAPKGSKPFERVDVMISRSGFYDEDRFQKATVTSIANDKYANDVWVSVGGDRHKMRADDCYLITAHNSALMNQITATAKRIEVLQKSKGKLYDQLEKLYIEKEDQL